MSAYHLDSRPVAMHVATWDTEPPAVAFDALHGPVIENDIAQGDLHRAALRDFNAQYAAVITEGSDSADARCRHELRLGDRRPVRSQLGDAAQYYTGPVGIAVNPALHRHVDADLAVRTLTMAHAHGETLGRITLEMTERLMRAADTPRLRLSRKAKLPVSPAAAVRSSDDMDCTTQRRVPRTHILKGLQ